MTMMTRLLTLLALVLTLPLAPRVAMAQAGNYAPVITVNGLGITDYEISQREKFLKLLGTPQSTREDAEKALIEDRLRTWAGKQLGMKMNEEALTRGMSEFASRGNLSTKQFITLLGQNGIDPNTFRDFVAAGVIWREVVRARFAPLINVTSADVDRAMMPESQTGKGVKVLISEAIVPAPPGQEAAALAQARQLSAAKGEGAFAALARKYSAAPTRDRGGRLEWMPIDKLPAQLRGPILALKPGTATGPIQLNGAVAVFMLRAIGDGDAPSAPQDLSYMTLNLGATGSAQAANLAAQAAADARVCNQLYTVAKGLPESAITLHEKVAQSAVPTDEALVLAQLDPGETQILRRGGSDVLVMLCSREVADTKDQPAPDRKTVRSSLEDQALGAYATGYLADLEAEAVIVRK
ncbi:MAG: peptidylprolyl isomerase [Thioclava marina]|uniref:peptidylprolyl isomerase n=1 Tax=Thioclava marina TaxID=1915077 RepID=UPI0019BA983A|nr:peptidylprolyl isomerase [Thioclava marina]MBC7143886.1 peptidylprolyl isomerase [Thioclava marina]